MSVWSDAKDKRTARRAAGANCLVVPNLVNTLNGVAGLTLGAAAANTNNTYVVAYLASQDLYMAAGFPTANRGALVLNLNATLQIQLAATDVVHINRITNLHAEMAVVRYVCNTYNIDKGALGGDLTVVCTGKGCCADCCGWMTRYNIDHGPTCNADGSDQGWMHPLTGATFRGEDDDDFTYSKSSKYKMSATYLNKNPKPV